MAILDVARQQKTESYTASPALRYKQINIFHYAMPFTW